MTMTIKKSVAGFALAAVAMFGVVSSANAQTPSLESLLAQIAALQAQIAAMQGGSSSATCGTTTYGYTATSTLRQGMSGAAVSALQSALNNYAGASLSTDGAFGPATRAAVVAFQASKGLSADGIAGPATQGALQNASMMSGGACDSDDDSDNDSSELNGDFGTISDVNELSQYNNEEVGEGEDDVVVLGFEVEADSDGDIMIQSVRVSFDSTGNTGSDNLDDYVSEVKVWFDGEEVGSADGDEFSESGAVFTKTIGLDNGVIIDADATEKILVSVSAVNAFDSADISGDSWTVDVENVRYMDGSGVVTTETGYDLDGMDVPVDFVSYSAAADTELKISTDSDSPEAGIVIVDDATSTDDVVLLIGKIRLDGTSDVVIDELPITFSPVGANINVMAESLKLVIDGEEYTESVPSIADGASGTVTFDNLDFDMEAGDTIEFSVLADMTDMDGSIFAEGDTLSASLTATNRDYIDAENEEGDQLSDSTEKSGTANGDAQEFRTEGIAVTLVGTPSGVALPGDSANDDSATFTIKFNVEAIGDTVYVSSAAVASLNTTGNGAVAGVERAGTATIGGVTVTIVNNDDTDQTANGNFMIEEGEEEQFTMTVTVSLPSAGSAGQYRALLRALDWSTSDDAVISGTGYTTNLDEFMTDYIFLN